MQPLRSVISLRVGAMMALFTTVLGCTEPAQSTEEPTCDEVQRHLLDLHAQAAGTSLPAHVRAAYGEALAANAAALVPRCDGLTPAQRRCAMTAQSGVELARCNLTIAGVSEQVAPRAPLEQGGPSAQP